ncbi:YdcF family protein [Actinomycetes bacterium M1A6_2h]
MVFLVVAIGLGGWGVAGVPLFVNPKEDDLSKADAIIVLGGPEEGREEYAQGLASAGLAPVLVYSNPYGPKARGMLQKCAAQETSYTVICFDPEPATTMGEARFVARMAVKNDWKKIIVITYRPHISRARYIFGKCFDGTVLMAKNDAPLKPLQWVEAYIYQTGAFAKALTERGC